MKIIFALTGFLFSFLFTTAQQKDCFPNCNVTTAQLEKLRTPSKNDVIGTHSTDWIIVSSADIQSEDNYEFKITGNKCGNMVANMLEQYRKEDQSQLTYLRNQACSYQSGWIEKVQGECQAGGPPPCCPVDHWYKADATKALDYYKSLMKKTYDERMAKIGKAISDCRKSLYRSATDQFNTAYSNTYSLATELQKLYPQYSSSYQSKYIEPMKQLQTEFQSAITQSSSPKVLQQTMDKLAKINDELKQIQTTAKKDASTQPSGKNNGNQIASNQNNNSSQTVNNSSTNLLSTNANVVVHEKMMSDVQNTKDYVESKFQSKSWDEVGKDINSLIASIQNNSQRKQQIREMRQQRAEYNFLMTTTQLLNNRVGYIYTNSYEKIDRKYRRPAPADLSDYEYPKEQSQGIAQEIESYVQGKNMEQFFEKIGNLLDDPSLTKANDYAYYKGNIHVSTETYKLINWVYNYCMTCASQYSPGQVFFWRDDKKYKKEYDKKIKGLSEEKLLPNEALHLGYINFEKTQSKEFLGNFTPNLDFAYNLFNYVVRKSGSSYHQMNAHFFMGLIKKAQAIEKSDTVLMNQAISHFNQAKSISLNEFMSFKNSTSYSENLNYYLYYVEPEYYWYLRLCIMEENINAIAEMYKLDKTFDIQAIEEYLSFGSDYFSTK